MLGKMLIGGEVYLCRHTQLDKEVAQAHRGAGSVVVWVLVQRDGHVRLAAYLTAKGRHVGTQSLHRSPLPSASSVAGPHSLLSSVAAGAAPCGDSCA